MRVHRLPGLIQPTGPVSGNRWCGLMLLSDKGVLRLLREFPLTPCALAEIALACLDFNKMR